MHVLLAREFETQMGKLRGELGRRARMAARTIEDSTNPASLGKRKRISHIIPECPKCAFYAYNISKSYRILYCVGDDCLVFVRVGDHKAVYKKG